MGSAFGVAWGGRRDSYKPAPRYEEYLQDQIEELPHLRKQKEERVRSLLKDYDTMAPRAQAAGVDLYSSRLEYPELDFEPDVNVFMDRLAAWYTLRYDIKDIEAQQAKIEAARRSRGKWCLPKTRWLDWSRSLSCR